MTDKKAVKYRIQFLSQGSVYQLYARYIAPSDMFGFIKIEELLFGTNSVVLDPSEDKLKTEFAGVNRIYVPMNLVLRIDEVEKEGVAKIVAAKGGSDNISQFPPLNPIHIDK